MVARGGDLLRADPGAEHAGAGAGPAVGPAKAASVPAVEEGQRRKGRGASAGSGKGRWSGCFPPGLKASQQEPETQEGARSQGGSRRGAAVRADSWH